MSLRLWAELGDTTQLSERVLGVLRFRWEEMPGRAALGSPPPPPTWSIRPKGSRPRGTGASASLRAMQLRAPRAHPLATQALQIHPPNAAPPKCVQRAAHRPVCIRVPSVCVPDQPQLGTRQPRDSLSPAAGGEGRVACRLVMTTCSVKRGPASPSTPVRARVCTCERARACPPGACFRSGGPRGLHDPAKPNREHPRRCGCGIEDRRETEFAGAHADAPSASGMRARTRGPASPRHRVPSLLRDAPASRSELLC